MVAFTAGTKVSDAYTIATGFTQNPKPCLTNLRLENMIAKHQRWESWSPVCTHSECVHKLLHQCLLSTCQILNAIGTVIPVYAPSSTLTARKFSRTFPGITAWLRKFRRIRCETSSNAQSYCIHPFKYDRFRLFVHSRFPNSSSWE
jgi:hypothetical protein